MSLKFKHLVGLRGIASFVVMMAHMQMLWSVAVSRGGVFDEKNAIWEVYNTVFNGNFSVCIFFILSGYVVLLGFYNKKDSKYLMSSAIKRYFRLTPIPLAAVVMAWIVYSTFGFHNKEASQLMGGIAWFSNPYSFHLELPSALYQGLVGIYHGEFNFDGALWTIQIELFGSIALFLITYFIWNKGYFVFANLLLSFLAITLLGNYGLYFCLFLAGGSFCRITSFNLNPCWAFLGLALGLQNDGWTITSLMQQYLPSNITASVLCHVLGAIIIFYSINSSKKLMNFLSLKPFTFLGDISFSLYAIHLIVLFSAGSYVFVILHLVLGANASALIAMFTTIISTIFISVLMTKTIDNYSQRLANKIGSVVY